MQYFNDVLHIRLANLFKAVEQASFFSLSIDKRRRLFLALSGLSETDSVASLFHPCRHLAREWMQMTAMDARTHKASVLPSVKNPQAVTFDWRRLALADSNEAALSAEGNGGESSTEQEFYGGAQVSTVRSPNSQPSSPPRTRSGQPFLPFNADHKSKLQKQKQKKTPPTNEIK